MYQRKQLCFSVFLRSKAVPKDADEKERVKEKVSEREKERERERERE